MREERDLQLARIALRSLRRDFGFTVMLGRGRASIDGRTTGPVGWRARAVQVGTNGPEGGGGGRLDVGGDWEAWATRPYEAVCRLAERLDRAVPPVRRSRAS